MFVHGCCLSGSWSDLISPSCAHTGYLSWLRSSNVSTSDIVTYQGPDNADCRRIRNFSASHGSRVSYTKAENPVSCNAIWTVGIWASGDKWPQCYFSRYRNNALAFHISLCLSCFHHSRGNAFPNECWVASQGQKYNLRCPFYFRFCHLDIHLLC